MRPRIVGLFVFAKAIVRPVHDFKRGFDLKPGFAVRCSIPKRVANSVNWISVRELIESHESGASVLLLVEVRRASNSKSGYPGSACSEWGRRSEKSRWWRLPCIGIHPRTTRTAIKNAVGEPDLRGDFSTAPNSRRVPSYANRPHQSPGLQWLPYLSRSDFGFRQYRQCSQEWTTGLRRKLREQRFVGRLSRGHGVLERTMTKICHRHRVASAVPLGPPSTQVAFGNEAGGYIGNGRSISPGRCHDVRLTETLGGIHRNENRKLTRRQTCGPCGPDEQDICPLAR